MHSTTRTTQYVSNLSGVDMKVTSNCSFYDRLTAERYNRLQTHGITVSLFSRNASDAAEWCNATCKSEFAWSYDSSLITPEVYHRSLLIDSGEIPNPALTRDVNWLEDKITQSLALEMQRDIDRAILEELGVRMPEAYFWFEDANEAMMFKLTWGGE